jgi:hypothetical protein
MEGLNVPHVAIDGGTKEWVRRGDTTEVNNEQEELGLYPLLRLFVQPHTIPQLVLREKQQRELAPVDEPAPPADARLVRL